MIRVMSELKALLDMAHLLRLPKHEIDSVGLRMTVPLKASFLFLPGSLSFSPVYYHSCLKPLKPKFQEAKASNKNLHKPGSSDDPESPHYLLLPRPG